MNTNRKSTPRNLIFALPVLVLVGITTLSGNQGTPGTVEATTVALSEHETMTGATLSEMHARIAVSNDEPEPAPTF
jgi:hypothetical protein